ncbi:MAG: hypothetical protein C4294_06500, partial [Nitrospiraceae bacterium]
SVRAQYIVAHTLKGASSLYGFSGVADLAGTLEVLVEKLKEVPAEEWPSLVAMLRDLLATLRAQIETIKEKGTEDQACCDAWKARFSHLLPVLESTSVLSDPTQQAASLEESFPTLTTTSIRILIRKSSPILRPRPRSIWSRWKLPCFDSRRIRMMPISFSNCFERSIP